MQRSSSVHVALSGLLMLAVAMGIGRFAFTPLLPMMQKDAGLSLAGGGWLATANYVGYLLGALTAIRMRFSAARIVLFSLFATAVVTAAMGFGDDWTVWFLLRGLAGVASAWALVFAAAWALQALAATGRPRLAGLMFAGVGFGIALVGVLCLQFATLGWSSARSWIALGVVALLLTLIAAPGFLAAPRPSSATTIPAAESSAVASPDFRSTFGLVIAYALFGFGYIIPATFLPAMAKRLIADPSVFGLAWPIFGVAGLVSTLIAGHLLRRHSNRALWGTSHLIMGVGAFVPVILPNMVGIALSAICVGGTFMVITLAAMEEARRMAPLNPARFMAQLTVAFAIGQILGPMFVSILPQGSHTLDALLSVAAALLVISGIGLYRSSRLTPLVEAES
ncbi:MAG: YbfB/YjiJ family MFS transporter [Gammaproteobacteria bacterium]